MICFVYEPFLGNSARSENQKNGRFKFLEFQILGWTQNLNHVFSAMNMNWVQTTKNSNSKSNSNELLAKVRFILKIFCPTKLYIVCEPFLDGRKN